MRPKTDTDVIFTTSGGTPISQNTFRYTLEKYAKKAGIDKPITPHTLRHSFATHLLAEGVSVYIVSKYLGHEDLSSTAIYLHLVDEDYAAGVDSLPRKARRGAPLV